MMFAAGMALGAALVLVCGTLYWHKYTTDYEERIRAHRRRADKFEALYDLRSTGGEKL